MIREQITAKLEKVLQPVHIEVLDESHLHNVPVGAESHFKVVIVSDEFVDKRMLERHRSVYGTLAVELAGSVHALALHTYSVEEWSQRYNSDLVSPACRGVGK